MLPDFRIPLILSGVSHQLLVQDVPACVFWQGYPDASQEMADRDRTQAEAWWYRHLLIRVTLQPGLDLDWVLTWGNDYELPVRRYLEAVGFIPKSVAAPSPPGELLDLDVIPRLPVMDLAPFRGCVPTPQVQQLVRILARSMQVPASQLWLMFASEFFFNYHVHLSEEEKSLAPLPEIVRA